MGRYRFDRPAHYTPMGFRIQRNPILIYISYFYSGDRYASPEKRDKRLSNNAAARTLGVLHLAHRLMLLAAHAAPVGGLTIPITAFVETSIRIAHNRPPIVLLWAGRRSTTASVPAFKTYSNHHPAIHNTRPDKLPSRTIANEGIAASVTGRIFRQTARLSAFS